MDIFVKYLGYLIVLVVLAVPLGFYINKVMNGKKVFLSRILEPCENFIYRVLHVKKDEEMSWKKYLVSVLIFSGFGLVFVFLLQMLQGVLPGNPAKVEGTTWDLALNTAISFVTNTNWQAYSGESGLSYLTQSLGLTVQNFVSAGTGLAVLYALIRGFTRIKAKGLGNFWVDLTRSVIYVLMPLSVVLSIILVSQGVTQSIDEYQTVKLAEPIVLEDGTEITEQTVPLGPAASQIAIKQLGTNGGGFYVDISNHDQAGGNMEGKESRFGIVGSSTWAAFTTAASNGSVNSMHDSYTPLGGMVTMLLMQLGEVIFGGVGCGLYGMLGFVILAVFMAGLMVGRTPEYLGKKIEPYEMKWAVVVCLATPVAILVGSGIASLVPQVADSLNNSGAHGFSELLYAYSSAGGNNGSAFAGFAANTPFINVTLGLVMLFVRFIPILGILAIAGSMVQKKKVAVTAGTLSTCSPLFVFLLVFVVLLVGALSFFPALALGPIAEFFGMF